MLFRSLRSLAGRALAAGAASALTLTLFNAAQPTLGNHQIQPGTLKDVKITLTPVAPGAGGCEQPRACLFRVAAARHWLGGDPAAVGGGGRWRGPVRGVLVAGC